jgi:hypothetical protein
VPIVAIPLWRTNRAPGTSSRIGESDMNCAVEDMAAEALFVSDMQPSECPSQHDIEQAITAMLLCYGSDGCAAELAEQFGDHPEASVRRLSWVHSELACITAW